MFEVDISGGSLVHGSSVNKFEGLLPLLCSLKGHCFSQLICLLFMFMLFASGGNVCLVSVQLQ